VVPVTTNIIEDAEPLRIRVAATSLLSQDSDLLIDQLRAIDNHRLVEGPLARIDEPTFARIAAALREVLDLG
jgi:mRNA interferase MazF